MPPNARWRALRADRQMDQHAQSRLVDGTGLEADHGKHIHEMPATPGTEFDIFRVKAS